uniref:Uncharacterized protein n=1 Tax=Solanum lycopersicum TaxID=4081 RepID=A0A3Q7GU07_SOLLC
MRLCCGKVSDSEAAEVTTFDKWLLQIGDGSFYSDVDNDLIKVPTDICIMPSNDPIGSIVDAVYPSLLQKYNDPTYLQEREILTPKNEMVHELNDTIMKMIQGEGRTYFSSDNVCKSSVNTNDEDLLYPTEFLNSLRFPGIPNHEVQLKVGTPVMLLRNLNQSEGLCNGTRLIVTHLGCLPETWKSLSSVNNHHKKDPNVKFSIKSFKVPELYIEVPQTATVGSLKQKTPLAFRSYNGTSCCNSTDDKQLQTQFNAMNISDSRCASLVKSVICAAVEPLASFSAVEHEQFKFDKFSTELFRTDSVPRRLPILCNSKTSENSNKSSQTKNDFCSEVWTTCQNVSIISSPFAPSVKSNSTKLTDLWKSQIGFCNEFGGASGVGSQANKLSSGQCSDHLSKPPIFVLLKRCLFDSDDEGNLMHGIIRKNQVNRFKDKLNEGSVFIIKNFKVVESIGGYRPIQNSLKIIFFPTTAIKNLSEDIVEIPVNGFEFINPDVIDSRVNNNIVLSDVVGCLYEIGDIESVGSKWKKRDIHILTDYLPREEEMFLNRMDIKELLEAEWSSELQEYIVTVKSKIIEIHNYFGWYYISCNVCSKKIEPTNSIYRCHNCNKDCKFPLVRYKIHLKVTDRTGDTTFILFNAVAEKLLDTSAHKLFNKLTTANNDVSVQLWIPDDNLEVQYKLRKEEKGKNLSKNETDPKDQGTNGLTKQMNNQVSVDELLTDLEDYEDEAHVTNSAKNRKRRNLIIDDEELSVQDTNKFKK